VGLRRSRWLVAALTLALVVEQFPARLPFVGSAIPASADAAAGYDAAFAGASVTHSILSPGQSEAESVFFANIGATSWLRGTGTQVDFAVCNGAACDVASPNASWNTAANPWLSATRYATSTQAAVAPGELAEFFWVITVPAAATPGVYIFEGDLVVAATGEAIHRVHYEKRVLVVSSTYTVNVSTDSATDTGCDAAHCSLRGAITAANANAGADLIAFSLPSGETTILLTSALPVVTDPVWIDGATQPGVSSAPLVTINGAGAGPSSDGLVVAAGSSMLRSLVVNGFGGGAGIRLTTLGRNELIANYIGTNAAGTAAVSNAIGVAIESADNAIGSLVGGRNVISGNSDAVVLYGPRNRVIRALIGTNASGTAALPNVDGIVVGGNDNTIGRDFSAFEQNVISGNSAWGILVTLPSAAPTGTVIQGNYIGTNAAGTGTIPNGQAGILAIRDTTIGGATAAARNLISGNQVGIALRNASPPSTSPSGGNTVLGNYIGTTAPGTLPLPNVGSGVDIESPNNTIGGPLSGARNVISGNGGPGVRIATGADANTVQGNYIGLGSDGRADVANHVAGLAIHSADNVVSGNVISGNNSINPPVQPFDHGVVLNGTGATGNIVAGNFIGPRADGTAGFPNAGAGVLISGGASNNTIGGSRAVDRNVISGNSASGVALGGASGNVIQGNYIGVGPDGQTALANGNDGITFSPSGGVTVGANTFADNVIAANARYGISIENAVAAHVIRQNYIGLAADRQTVRPNGNVGLYIYLGETPQDAAMAISDNYVSGNAGHGMYVYGVDGASITNNQIGYTVVPGAIAGNGSDGIAVLNSANLDISGNNIAGNAAGIVLGANDTNNVLANNAIVANGSTGILFNSAGTTGNTVVGGSITGHTQKGIVIASGAQGGVQPPAITQVVFGSTFTVSGTSIPNAIVQIYADPDDEGLEFLASTTASEIGTWTNSTWSLPDTTALQAAIRAGARKLHATQTHAFGTSEFSAAPAAQSSVAYVYATDTAARDALSSMLSSRNYTVTGVTVANAATFDFSTYMAIVIGHDTGNLSSWGTQASIDQIRNSGVPIVGVGEGGYAYFGKLGLGIGWPNGWHGSGGTGVNVADATDVVWSAPNLVSGTTGALVGLYSSGSSYVSVYYPTATGSTVTIGREVGDLTHYPLIAVGDCYALWGFDNSPATMTTAGANLFENFIANGGAGCGTTEISGLVRTVTGAGISAATVAAIDGLGVTRASVIRGAARARQAPRWRRTAGWSGSTPTRCSRPRPSGPRTGAGWRRRPRWSPRWSASCSPGCRQWPSRSASRRPPSPRRSRPPA